MPKLVEHPGATFFRSQTYWNDRFTSNTDPFEWLEAPNAVDSFIVDALSTANLEKPELLHIGCGTSLLSYHLRSLVDDPKQIHNLDYSDVAIELGKRREHETYPYGTSFQQRVQDGLALVLERFQYVSRELVGLTLPHIHTERWLGIRSYIENGPLVLTSKISPKGCGNQPEHLPNPNLSLTGKTIGWWERAHARDTPSNKVHDQTMRRRRRIHALAEPMLLGDGR